MTDERLTHIRAALADGADDLTRQRGINACRDVMATLGARADQPTDEATAPTPTQPPTLPSPSTTQPNPPSRLADAARLVATAPPTLILDAVIAKLKAQLPQEDAGDDGDSPGPTLRIPFIPVPNVKGRS